jgi:MoaA/NifB/PqqE/SkfB family radical SAM enzyme
MWFYGGSSMKNVYNKVSSNGLKIDLDEPFCNRAKLDTGTQCNYACTFCYYLDKLDDVTPFEIIKDRIDYLAECGIEEVDLSGGESSIHKDWFKILDYCKSKGLRISTLSNGYKFKSMEFLQKSKDHGLEEILFSLHGYDEESHNKIVRHSKGFTNIIQSIKNANKIGIKVRINCTVQKDNYMELSTKFVTLVKPLKPLEVNFITLNYWNDAEDQTPIDYNQITPEIHKTIDTLRDYIPLINVRYTPYCFMKGYEEYVCDYYQHIYDIYDWNIAVYDYLIPPEKYKYNELKYLFSAAKHNREESYYKPKECFDCKFFNICDGIENQIKSIKIHPESGEKIKDINHFRKNYYRKA